METSPSSKGDFSLVPTAPRRKGALPAQCMHFLQLFNEHCLCSATLVMRKKRVSLVLISGDTEVIDHTYGNIILHGQTSFGGSNSSMRV